MVREKEAQKQLELMLLQQSQARLEQEDAHKQQKHSRSHNQKQVFTEQMRDALLRKQDLLQDKQYKDILIMEKLTREAEEERERANKAREEKRLREK